MFRQVLSFISAALIACSAFAAQAVVDVNKANQAELESIKGIGPGLSTRILQARAGGGFKDWSDMIERVSGVGPNNAARYSKAGLTVGGTSFDAAAVATTKARRAGKAEADAGMQAKPRKARSEAMATH